MASNYAIDGSHERVLNNDVNTTVESEMKDSQDVSAITSSDAKKSNETVSSTALGAFEQRLRDKANGNKEDGGAKNQGLEQVNEETNSQHATTKKVPELIASEEDLPKPPGASTAAFDESIEKKNSKYATKKAPELIGSDEDLPKPPGAYEEVGAVKFNEKMGGLEIVDDNEGPSLSPIIQSLMIAWRRATYNQHHNHPHYHLRMDRLDMDVQLRATLLTLLL